MGGRLPRNPNGDRTAVVARSGQGGRRRCRRADRTAAQHGRQPAPLPPSPSPGGAVCHRSDRESRQQSARGERESTAAQLVGRHQRFCRPLWQPRAGLERRGTAWKMRELDRSRTRALTFDVFGTVVDWRGSIVREGEGLGALWGIRLDWVRFADAWRALYQPSLERVRRGELPWTRLDDLHRMALEKILSDFGVTGLKEEQIEHLNRAWHRLDPWPDAIAGLSRLKRQFILATLSNGNVALLVNMAKRAGLPWDAILGAEVARHYKPQPEAYLTTASLLGLRPDECMMVAAHNGDLAAASAVGLRTAFVPRPTEHGPGQSKDVKPARDWDVVASDFVDLAARLGC